MSEKDICIMESEMIAAVDEYIAARPQLDSIYNRRIYESGFKAGYGKLESANADLQRRLDEATRAFGQAAKERAEALKIIEDSRKQEPSVYILPSVLRQCETTEMNAHVYSVPFTNFDIGEQSVPLYKEPVAARERTEP